MPTSNLIQATNKNSSNGKPFEIEETANSFPVNQAQTFQVILNHKDIKPNDLIITITNPLLGNIEKQIEHVYSTNHKQQLSKCLVTYLPPLVGIYSIDVELINQQQPYSLQFQSKAYDLSKVFINNSIGSCVVNGNYEFSVDASEAGEGQLEIAVNEGEIPNQVQVLDNGKCIVNFVPEDSVPHIVDIKFNGHNVNGCPFVVEVYDSDNNNQLSAHEHQFKGYQPEPILIKDERILVDGRAIFSIENVASLASISYESIKEDLIILDPENQAIEYDIVSEQELTKHTFKFDAKVVGDYTIKLKQSSTLLKLLPKLISEQFPFFVKVFNHTKVLVSDVTDGVIGHPIYFFIDASQAGSGNLEIRVSSKTRNVPNYPQSETNAKIRVNFTPTEAVDHLIDIKFNGLSVPNNPFLVKVAQYPQARLPITSQDILKYIPLNENSAFFVDYLGSTGSVKKTNEEPSCQIYLLQPSYNFKIFKPVEYKDKKFRISFKPTEIGPNKLFITVNNELLPSSPIVCNVFDINQVKVAFGQLDQKSKRPIGRINEPVNFTVDASKAGEGTLALAVLSNLSKEPVQTDVKVSEEGHGLYELTFVPTELANHSIDMSFNDQVVPNSPFLVEIIGQHKSIDQKLESKRSIDRQQQQQQLVKDFDSMDVRDGASKLKHELNSTKMKHSPSTSDKVQIPTFGLVNASNILYLESGILENSRLQVNLSGPKDERVLFTLAKGSPRPGEPKKPYIEYKPKSIGTHEISIFNEGEKFRQYFVEICDPSSVEIVDIDLQNDSFVVGKPISFSIDSSKAGKIQLDSINILYTQAKLATSTNGQKLNGKSRISENQTLFGKIKSISTSNASSTGNSSGNQSIDYSLELINEYKQRITFTPNTSGKYTIDIRCLGQPVGYSPFDITVLDLQQVEQERKMHENSSVKSGNLTQKYSKDDDLLQSIIVHGVSLKNTPVNSIGAFIIETNQIAQARDFDVLITDPSNNLVNVQCYLQQDGNLLAEWTPKRIGTHKIEVLYRDNQVPGSPFMTEAFDPSGVVIEQLKGTQYKVHDKIEFVLNREQAGYGELNVAITSPLGQNLPINVEPIELEGKSDERELVSFTPTVAGNYKMSITFSGYEVPKSPITFVAKDNVASKNNDQLIFKIGGSGLKCAEINRSAQFNIDINQEGELKIQIESGGREIIPKIEKRSNFSHVVRYRATEIGFAKISIYFNGLHLSKSPYTVPINDLSKILFLSGTNKSSTINNQRLIDYEPHVPKEITLDTSNCGPGELQVEAYCRANPNLKFSIPANQYVKDRYKIVFSCPPKLDLIPKGLNLKDFSTDTTYMIRFYFNNLAVPENLASIVVSPYQNLGSISTGPSLSKSQNISDTTLAEQNNNFNTHSQMKQSSNSSKSGENLLADNCPVVALRGHGLVEANCGERAEFTIDGTEAGPGQPEVSLTCNEPDHDGYDIAVELEQLSDRVYKAVYVAQSIGTYTLNVLWEGKQVAGCPITINILGQCDPSKVICTGDGLKGGVLGEEIKTFIDTRRAGPGELTALCTGPQKVAFCELLDRGDGTFILYIKPQEPGRQFLTIKYGGQHIPKSPFLIKVSGKPDPSKVRVHGPGVEHGVLSLYQSRFVCDTRGAGAGQLTVRIRGPKGAFRMETQRESQKDRTILCKYDPTEPGDYRIEIKWSGKHVPGSPFSVMIFDTQEELNRFLMVEHNSEHPHKHLPGTRMHPGQHHSHIPYQPTMVEYGQFSNVMPHPNNQSPFRM